MQILGTELSHLPATLGPADVKQILPSAHRFANMLADTVQFALLCEQALWSSKKKVAL